MSRFAVFAVSCCLGMLLSACASPEGEDGSDAGTEAGEEGGADPQLRIVLDVDPEQIRLDNFGEPAPEPPEGHAAQDPEFLLIGAHSAELVPDAYTLLDEGTQLFDSPHREGGVDFAELPVVTPSEELASVDLATLEPGTYEHLRVSVSFQRYRVEGHAEFMGIDVAADVEIASFVEGETYIDEYELGDEVVTVGAVKEQGYYGAWSMYTGVIEGQVPVGATTVPNPLDETSPIPVGSCVVTATFDEPFVITGDEDQDVVLHVSLSTNTSFEWIDGNSDGLWQPFDEQVVDMGLRGMVVSVE
jgi:hypothetical protein